LSDNFGSAIAIATQPGALRVLTPFCLATHTPLLLPEKLRPSATLVIDQGAEVQFYTTTLREALTAIWPQQDACIFGLATGAVVRLIAPLLQDKAVDPAVVVVDEAGKFVISLCGGHQGGSDRWAHWVSQYLLATVVTTGSAHHLGLSGIDILGTPFGWTRGSGDWTGVASVIARQLPVQVIQDAGTELWQTALPSDHTFQFGWSEVPATDARPAPQARVWISPIQRRLDASTGIPKVQWHPRVLWIGLGCERDTPQDVITAAISTALQSRQLAMGAIAGLATIMLKADEEGLLALCQARHWPLQYFTAEELATVSVPHPSEVVEAAVGTPSVAEAAALLAAQRHSVALDRTAIAPAVPRLWVSKQIFRQPGQPGAVTVAIAEANREYLARTGHLALVGTGPGSLDQITPAARGAIAQADVIVGYSLYADLIRPLLRPGQLVEALPITQEQVRAERAIALAHWGLTVAVVSSGDCGIYGMAGLVLETLEAQGWDGLQPTVETFPGISALQSAAARVGAPLMHDFCAISLSDLLTPWTVIETRLQAAAAADFVVILYNPKSQKRTTQIEIARRIFLQHRAPTTPVAIVRSAYRPAEECILTTLDALLQHPIDMLTTVIIGNHGTRQYGNYLITPRGYRDRSPLMQ
jgi:cobalt-precorrin 5A hydrolase/precorrin-3B C17-methyltransferase